MSRDVRNEKTEARIKGALLQTLSVKPFTETSVSELAHEAQVSRTSIYTHFGSLEGVFRAAAQEQFGEQTEMYARKMGGGFEKTDGGFVPTGRSAGSRLLQPAAQMGHHAIAPCGGAPQAVYCLWWYGAFRTRWAGVGNGQDTALFSIFHSDRTSLVFTSYAQHYPPVTPFQSPKTDAAQLVHSASHSLSRKQAKKKNAFWCKTEKRM